MRKFIIFLAIFFSSVSHATVINSIVIEGNERVESESIKSYLDIIPGVNFTNEQLDSSLKKLYASSLFQKVEIIPENDRLYVKVIENPKINLLVFEGNSKIKTKELESEILLKPRMIYTKAKVQEDVNYIIDLYRKNGRFSAKVTPQIIELPQNRVNLIFKIDEGPATKIGKIIFIGNKAFSNRTLRDELSSKETRWYYFLSSSDQFNPSRLEYDRELLTRFYNSRGYADFKIISMITNISESKERFYVTITVDEGLKYNFGKIEVNSRLKLDHLNNKQMKSIVTTKEKSIYDAKKIEKSIDLLIKRINDEGYAFVDVNPEIHLNAEDKTASITYHVGEGSKVYINKINITGNGRTMDKVIRREFRLAEGDPYNATKITRSEQRINNLDFFEKTNIETERTEYPDKVDLNIKVQEKSTAGLRFAGGYSTADGMLGSISLTERNLLGKGQAINITLGKSKHRWDIATSFMEPYLFGRPIAGSIDLFTKKHERDNKQYQHYDHSSDGIGFGVGYEITEYLRHNVHYSITRDKISNIDSNAAAVVQTQQGSKVKSLIGQSFSYDRRNNATNPSEGYVVVFSQDFAGLGGDAKFLKHELKGRYYYPIMNEDVVLMLAGEVGEIHGVEGKPVYLVDRFFLGGADSLRGFELNGVGPRTNTTNKDNDALGGNIYYTSTAEIKFPLGLGKDLGLFGSTFIDAGSLYKVDANQTQVNDSKKIRASCGVGLGFNTPMGPIRLHYARPISKAKFDQTKYFDISFSTNF